MPRKARQLIIAPGCLYHVVSRGNNQQRIFREGRAYRKFLQILDEAKEKFSFYVYAYSLMPNHYHLEAETQNIPISKIIHRINFLYAKFFHHRHHTSGHLFQDRFFSALIDKDSYLWEAARYIDLNAWRAGLVERPEEYSWGSYRTYYQNQSCSLVDQGRFLGYVDKNLEKARAAYIKFVEDGMILNKKPAFIDKNTT